MSLSIKDILDLEVMKDAELLVKGDSFEEPVSGITIMEAPDISKWVAKGYVILSNLYSLSGHEDSMDSFVSELKESKVAGMIVKTRYDKTLYTALLKSCQKYSFSLVKIPNYTLYTDIMQSVMGQLFSYQLSRANYFKACHETFMKIALSGHGTDFIIDTLSDMIHRKMAAYDLDGHVIACSKGLSCNYAELSEDREFIKVQGENLIYYKATVKLCGHEVTGTAIPFKALQRTKGFLFIEQSPDQTFNEYEWIAIENAINVLNLEMTKQLAVSEIEQRFKNDLVNDLLFGNIPSESIIYQRAQNIGWDFSKPHIAVVLNISFGNPSMSKSDIAFAMQGIHNALNRILAEGTGDFANRNIISISDNTINILWAAGEQKNLEKTNEFIKESVLKLFENCRERYGISCFKGGIGRCAESIYDISKSYGDALSAIRSGNIIYGENYITDLESLGVYRLIAQFEDSEKLEGFIPHSLQKLIAHDKETGGNLTETLDIYLSCDCNSVKAAQLMYVHYKTLVYRINRIKTIMEVENIEGDFRFELQLALKILHFTRHNKREK